MQAQNKIDQENPSKLFDLQNIFSFRPRDKPVLKSNTPQGKYDKKFECLKLQ
jgi:hypothetical protein